MYVPGDNEWTDCHRVNNGGYNALERLDFIRRTLFNVEQSFGQHKMALEHQGSVTTPYTKTPAGLLSPVTKATSVASALQPLHDGCRTLSPAFFHLPFSQSLQL